MVYKMKRYFKYVKPKIVFFILSPLLMLVEVYCDVKIPSLASEIINTGVINNSIPEIRRLAIFMLLYILIAIIAGVIGAFCATTASIYFSSSLRLDLFKKIQNLSFADIDKFSTGSLITRLTNDITQLEQLVLMSLRMLCRAPGMMVGSIIMAFSINSKMALIFFIIIPILIIIIGIILKLSYKRFYLLQEKVDSLNSNVREVLTNIRVIKGYHREEFEEEKFNSINTELKDTGLSAYRINILQSPLTTLVLNASTITVLWFANKLIMNNNMEIGDISAFITYLTQLLMSINMLTNVFLQSSRAMASSKRILKVFDTKTDIIDNPESELIPENGDISFSNVNFKYYKNNQELVLDNINIDIKSGETVGVIGSTGSGKTSFVNLIPRLYDVCEGEIKIAGRNVKDYSLKNLRDSISIVLQNNFLFSGSIEDNLRWGNSDATDKDLKQACDFAMASEFIESKQNKYNFLLEQGGTNLSGGQKQRLCIARALVKKPKILILDDSTSAVDTATESEIREHFSHSLKDVTKIIITQRISSVITCDKIIVFNNGAIEKCGTNDELMKSSKTYLEIYNSQVNTEVVN